MASIFSGKAGRNASIYKSMALAEGQKQANKFWDEGKSAATDYLNRNRDIFGDAHGRASELLNAAYDDAGGAISRSGERWQPFYDSGISANNMYSDAMGLNGAEGRARASQAFQAGPGYEFSLSQGLDAIQRTAAARGGLASGNTSTDLMKYANGLASQAYDSWLNQFNPLIQNGVQAAQGQAQSDLQAANLSTERGTSRAGLEQALAERLAGINASLADLESNTAGNKANLSYQTAQGIGESGAKGLMAGQEAAQNKFNAISSVASKLLDTLLKKI